ncbi:hypothetical protein GYA49_04355 [Candidatus Beckwithbacteria bacterium]|nr:hypothetical protein [Candidatus Beckwithbacteria bacterium]
MPIILPPEFAPIKLIKGIEEVDDETLKRILVLKTSKDFPNNSVIEIPNDPTFLHVDTLKLEGTKILGKPPEMLSGLTLTGVNVFFCHAESTRHKMWTTRSLISIPALLSEFKKSHSLAVALTCNPGSFKLDSDLIYPIGSACPIPFCYNYADKGISLQLHCAFIEREAFRPTFYVPARYFNKE